MIRRNHPAHRWLIAACAGCAACGCATRHHSIHTPAPAAARDRILAEELCDRADTLIPADPDAAERLLREALAADLLSGRAHNNLGVLLLERGVLYDAAVAFEAARRLMPDNAEPRLNLGLTLERAGRIDDAIDAYASALDVQPAHLGSIQALARAQLRHGRSDRRTAALLEQIALRADPHWRAWAAAHLPRAAH